VHRHDERRQQHCRREEQERTELIQEKNVRGSIGITFDMDTFMSALTSFVR